MATKPAANEDEDLPPVKVPNLTQDDIDGLKELDYENRSREHARILSKNLHKALQRDPSIEPRVPSMTLPRIFVATFLGRGARPGVVRRYDGRDSRALIQLTDRMTTVALELATRPLLLLAGHGFRKCDLANVRIDSQFKELFLDAGCLA